MATWNKTKVNASDVNNGNQFNVGDGLRNTDVNKIFESGLYSQDIVENIGIGNVTTGEPGSSAKASVTYDSSTGYPKINLTLPRGNTGPQGPSGSLGTISKRIISGSSSITVGRSSTLEGNFDTYIIYAPQGKGCIVKPGSGSVSDSFFNGSNEIEFWRIDYTINNNNDGTFTWYISYAYSTMIRFEEDGTITRENHPYASGSTIYDINLSGLNFEI